MPPSGSCAASRWDANRGCSAGLTAAISEPLPCCSLIVTAKMSNFDSQAWLADLLVRIAMHPVHRLDELLPWNWAPRPSTMVPGGGLTLPVNKVLQVYTIARVAEMLGENQDWLWDVANEMDQEDGLIWVHGPGDDSVMALIDFGIETITGLIEIYKANPDLLKPSTDLE